MLFFYIFKKKNEIDGITAAGNYIKLAVFVKNASRQTKRYTFIDLNRLEFIMFQFTLREDSV